MISLINRLMAALAARFHRPPATPAPAKSATPTVVVDGVALPAHYNSLSTQGRRTVREAYVRLQSGQCFWCKKELKASPLMDKEIDWGLFPGGRNFLRNPVHLQHDHQTGMTEGAVHAYCNAVMWQYHRR